MILVILLLVIMKKKNSIIMKNEKKKFVQKIDLGYCPNNIVRKKIFVLQGWIVLQPRQLGGLKLGCNTLECIEIEAAGLAKKLYCNTV